MFVLVPSETLAEEVANMAEENQDQIADIRGDEEKVRRFVLNWIGILASEMTANMPVVR